MSKAMIFWAVISVAAVLVALILGLAFRHRLPGGDSSVPIYRDQLAEVERDRARGVITDAEAERLRAEVARRLIEADRVAGVAERPRPGPGLVASAGIGVAVVAGSLGLYALLGQPREGDQPLTERLAEAEKMRADRPGQQAAEAQFGTPWTPPQGVDPSYLALVQKLREAVPKRADDGLGAAGQA